MSNKLKKRLSQIFLFALVMGFTFFTVFEGQDLNEILDSLKSLSPLALIAALISSFLYVSCEGFMIWFMFASHNGIKGFFQCISYAFIGFFYSGITPSASGGQPMQLYYIKKDGYSFSKSCATLTVIAAMNKFVLASVGVVLLIFFNDVINEVFYGHMGWYYLGLIMVVLWVVLLLFIMINPDLIERIAQAILRGLVKIHILKDCQKSAKAIHGFFDGYRDVKKSLLEDKKKVTYMFLVSYLQRFFLVVLTYIVYRGFGLSGSSIQYIMLVQIAIMISVDMLPLPGAQGITEFLYKRVFEGVFTSKYLTASMCVTRFANFYFLLLVGILVVLGKAISNHYKNKNYMLDK